MIRKLPALALLLSTALGAHAATQTFGDTGAGQSFVVPAGVTALTVTASGAQGGSGYNSPSLPGNGGTTTATIAVTPGETLAIFVGGRGLDGPLNGGGAGGFNGGADGGVALCGGGGGAGASDVRRGGSSLAERVVIAGGGAGTGANSGNISGTFGGQGGGLTGGTGGDNRYGDAFGGHGGSQTEGGTGGVGSNAGAAGTLGSGGAGSNTPYNGGGGGGGGGLYGGGAGGASFVGAGGGGGSSYAIPSATNVSMTQGDHTGPGQVVLAWSKSFSVSTDAELRAAIVTAEDGDVITFANDITLAGDLPAVQKSLTIDGAGHALDGANTYRGLFFAAWTPGTATFIPVAATVKSLTIRNAVAQGGSSTGNGGGGAGLGGALFVANLATVTVSNVALSSNRAVGGGSLGYGSAAGGGAGGGMGGSGGESAGLTGGGGGGLGLGADGGGRRGPNGVAGLATNAAAGGAGGADGGSVGGTGGLSGGGGGRSSGFTTAGGGGGIAGGAGNANTGGGAGGFGGGGGGGAAETHVNSNFDGGAGGYGGGGGGQGGNAVEMSGAPGAGGFGGGSGGFRLPAGGPSAAGFGGGIGSSEGRGSSYAGGLGGGGAGLGGAIFVMQGGSLTISDSLQINGNTVAGGNSAGLPGANPGSAFGSGLFFQGDNAFTFSPGDGGAQIIADIIGDQTGNGGTGGNGGAVSVTKSGAGTLVLSGANTYTGETTISAGVLAIVNSSGSATGSGAVNVQAGALLTGRGAAAGPVNLLGGTLNPDSNERLALGSVVWNGGSSVAESLVDGATAPVQITGALTKGTAGSYAIALTDGGAAPSTTYTLLTFGSNAGFSASDFTVTGLAGTLALEANALKFTTAALPPTYGVTMRVAKGRNRATFTITNTGSTTTGFALRRSNAVTNTYFGPTPPSPGTSPFKITYALNGQNITGAIEAQTASVNLGAGQSVNVVVKIQVKGGRKILAKRIVNATLTAASLVDPAQASSARARFVLKKD